MPVNLTVADVIDKNKIASLNAWVVLVAIDIYDLNNVFVETRYFANNNENVIYQANTYLASHFDLTYKSEANTEPSLTVAIFDPTNAIRDAAESYGGGVGFNVTFRVVNTGNLTAPPEIEEVFSVISSYAQDVTVNFSLGIESPFKYQFPYRMQYRDRCPWPYKGKRCGYTGALSSCDYSLNGNNGCKAHNNVANYGGFPGLNSYQA